MTTLRRRLNPVLLSVLLVATGLVYQAAPTTLPLPRPEALRPPVARAVTCADNPNLSGKLTQTLQNSGTPPTINRITSANVYGWISNVNDAWSCTASIRYSAIAWNTTATTGIFNWGNLIQSTSVLCNWVVGSTDYLKANSTSDCADSDTEYAMTVTLDDQRVYQQDSDHDTVGDFSFAHSDCDTYHGAEPVKGPGVGFGGGTANRPDASNCDPITIDGTNISQSIVFDNTPPALAFDWPPAGGPTLVTSAFAGVKFDATDNLAGFGASPNDWDLQRQVATWSAGACGTFANDPTAGNLVSGATSALDQVVSQGLADNTCYRWTLAAKDLNGNTAATITSGTIRTDLGGNLGRQPQHTFESWDLGAGDQLSVNVGTGNLVIDHPIVSLPIRGSSVDLSLTYNRHDTSNVGMGPGWRLNMLRRLTVNADTTVTFTDGTGARHTFTNPQVAGTVTTYTRPPTIYATLVKDTAIGANEFVLTYRDQSKDKFDIAGSDGLLVREEDRFGNGVTLAYSSGQLTSISDTAGGRTISLGWTSGNLTGITDWAAVSGSGVVQTSGAGNRLNRFFYSGGQLAGWADPLNTAGSCPGGGSHLTCISYPAGGLDIAKTQTVTTIGGTPAVLGTLLRTGPGPQDPAVTTSVTFANADVATVKNAQEVADAGLGTAFSHSAPFQTQVIRRGTSGSSWDTTTRYTLLNAANDAYARIGTVARKLGGGWLTTTTSYDSVYPIEPATVTEDAGGVLQRSTTTTYVASSLGLVARIDAPLDGTNRHYTDFTYNANNDVTQEIKSRGGDATDRTTTRFCYTTTGCSTSGTELALRATIQNYKNETPGDGTEPAAQDVTTTYQTDPYGQRTRETRQNYDATGALLDSRAIGSTFDNLGNQTSQIANFVDGVVDSPGDDITPNATTNARTDLTTVFTYDTAGNRVSSADPRRAIRIETGPAPAADDYVTRSTFDALNRRLTETTPTDPDFPFTQKTQSTTYDELGSARTASDFGGLVTASAFDRANRALQTFEDPDGALTAHPAVIVSQTTYDPSGRVLTTKDQRQVASAALGYGQSVYDELGRLLAQASAVGTTDATETDFGYDSLDRQTSMTTGVDDASAQRTITTFDPGDRQISVDDEFTCTSRTFDYRDLELTRIEGQGTGSCSGSGLRTVTNSYDGLGRLRTSLVTAGQGLNDKPLDQQFDAAGHTLVNASYVASSGLTTTVTSTFNPLDQVTAEIRSSGTWAKTNFDPAGNATDRCLWTTSPADPCKAAGSTFANPQPTSVTTSTFDARNSRVRLVDVVANSVTTYNPDENYQIAAFYLPTGGTKEHQTLYAYDERHRLAGVTHQLCAIVEHPCGVGNVVSTTGSDVYAYDVNDNRTRVNEANGATSVDRYYCYDALDRLVSTRTATGCSSGLLEGYGYDDSGNRTSAGSVTFSYSAAGQLASCSAGCGTVAHDTAGNVQKLNGWFYEYDAEGRMVRACQSTSCAGVITKVEFAYDGSGHRTQLKEYTTGTLVKTWDFRYQGDAIVEEKLTDSAHPAGAVVRSYIVDESGSVVKMTIPAGETGAGTYLVTWNGHGDALALHQINATSGALTLANSFTYTTWGAPTTATHNGIADLGFRFLYVGEFDVQWDNAYGLGLAYMHARHYSPALGRFLQPDPDASEANLYAYAANNPVTEMDPDGTCFIVCQIVIGAIIGAVVDTAVYLATTERSKWNLRDAAGAAARGAIVGGATSLGLGIVARGLMTAARTVQLTRWTRSAAQAVDRGIAARSATQLRALGARPGDIGQALSRGRLAGAGRGNIVDQLVKQRARNSILFRPGSVRITPRGRPGVDFSGPGVIRGYRTWDITTRGQQLHHMRMYPGAKLILY